MHEHEFPQKSELANCIVGVTSCLVAFLSKNTYSDVGPLDHVHIVGSVPYCKGYCFRLVFLDHADH